MQAGTGETGLRFDRSQSWTPPAMDTVPEQVADKQRRRQSAICCAQCGQRITEQAARMEYAGTHQYRFTNPGGYTFDVALFESAECHRQGPATMEYTWFSGFAWRLALCRNCHAHLGWHYSRAGQSGFYGLIRSRLVDVNEQ